MPRLKICYETPGYRSHRRVAEVYQRILERTCTLVPVSQYADADVVIIHEEPHDYAELYRIFPALSSKPVIACCVWEASDIPDNYKRSIAYVQEVWTCSRYCVDAFGRHHPNVHRMPYVIERDTSCTQEDIEYVKRTISYEPGKLYFITIARTWGGHKNVQGLAAAFERQRRHMPDARLVIKVNSRNPPRTFADPRIIWVPEDWSDSQMNALYQLGHVYVSAHYAEGWGLTMSDAMVFGKLVMATGYSGNLEFMSPDNSVLLDCEECEIRPGDEYFYYGRPMKWAYPDNEDLMRKLRWVYDAFHSREVTDLVRRASADLARFNRDTIEPRMLARLQTVMHRRS